MDYLAAVDQLTAGDPARIGPYRLIARLGAGGMGLVYLGRSEGGRTVAVKVVQAEHAGHPEFRTRFAREVAAARRVGGSWTADVLDADPEAAVPWVATQYIPGPDLHSVVAEDFGPLPEHSVHTLANRLALALQAVHAAGLIHRDLKPSNVLVTVDGPRVIDFGIARAMDSLGADSLHTRTGMLIGSPGFMSPEQVRGLELTPASDVFCLGAVLVYAATGRMLFGASDTGLNAHLFRVAEEEADLTGVPEALVDLVAACLDKDPAKRPTPAQIAARTATDPAPEWLPGAVLAQLGRHAAQLLDFAPEVTDRGPAVPSRPDPRVVPAPAYARSTPPPPAYAPTAPAHFAPGQGFGPPPEADLPHPRRWRGLAVAVLVALLDATAFFTGLPVIQADLGMAYGDLDLLITLEMLAFVGLLPLGGYLSDLLGRRLTLVIGLVGFAVASAIGGTAANPGMLIAARVLQGVFTALVTPAALALVAAEFTDPRERRKAFGIYAAVLGGGPVLGLLAGDLVLDYLSWRVWLYAGTVMAVIALVGALTLRHDRPGPTGARADVLGMLLGTFGLAALTYGAMESDGQTLSPLVLLLLVAGIGLLGGSLASQIRTAGAARSPGAVRGRDRIGSFLALLLAGVGLGTPLLLPVFLGTGLSHGPDRIGMELLPMAAALAIGSTQVSARLLPRVAPRVLIAAGLLVSALGVVLLNSFDDGDYLGQVLPGTVLIGFGIGLASMPVFAIATAGAAPRHAGGPSATLIAAPQLGGLICSVAIVSFNRNTALWWAFGSLLLAAAAAALLISAKAPAENGAPPMAKSGW